VTVDNATALSHYARVAADEQRFGIGDLASLGGVSRRTVRYYVQEGLLPPPLGVGRGNHYDTEHLDQLRRVKAMQEAGHTLEEIRRALPHGLPPPTAPSEARPPFAGVPLPGPARALWRRLPLAPGVELHVEGASREPTTTALRELAEWCRRHLGDHVGPPHEKDEDSDA
jgi:DNA-binding transcriptional MerR regulator